MPWTFPGMNPYLENPELWSEVHYRLITALADAIESEIGLKYRVAIEKRTYFSDGLEAVSVGITDLSILSQRSKKDKTPSITTLRTEGEFVTVTLPLPETVREGYLEIREVATGYVVTVIEVLSPSNKRAGMGRETYERKRRHPKVFIPPN